MIYLLANQHITCLWPFTKDTWQRHNSRKIYKHTYIYILTYIYQETVTSSREDFLTAKASFKYLEMLYNIFLLCVDIRKLNLLRLGQDVGI